MDKSSYYIVKDSGKQYFLKEGDKVWLDYKKGLKNGEIIDLQVINSEISLIKAEVIKSQLRGEKILIQKKTRRKGYERRTGFRADYTAVKILGVTSGN